MDDAAFQAYLETSLNPLHSYIRIARVMDGLWQEQCQEEGRPPDQLDFADMAEPATIESRARALEMRGMSDCFAISRTRVLSFCITTTLLEPSLGLTGLLCCPMGAL